jgi:hypothetical protein
MDILAGNGRHLGGEAIKVTDPRPGHHVLGHGQQAMVLDAIRRRL